MQLAITEMSSQTNTVNNTTVAATGAVNNKIRVNTKGFVKGCATGNGFEEETVYTEALHNGMIDIKESKEFRCSRYVDKRGRKWIMFANDGMGISVDELMRMQEMASYKGAREGKTGKYGIGLVALRSIITGDKGDVHMMSLVDDISTKYASVDEFITDMRDGGSNNDEGDTRFSTIHYNMGKVLSGEDETIKSPEDLPSIAAQLWKEGSVDPLKPGTLMAYQCCDSHWNTLERQLVMDNMDHSNSKFNMLFTARDAMIKDGKKLRWFDGKYLKAIPSLADYNEHLGSVQNFEINFKVTHKDTAKKHTQEFTRRENVVTHKFIELSPESMEYLPVEARTPGNRRFDKKYKKNVLPYICQEITDKVITY